MKIEKHGGNIYKYKSRVLDFSANLNPLGMPPEVKQAVLDGIDEYECYPDPDMRELKEAICRRTGVSTEHICCGNGGDDLIYRIILAFRPEKALLVVPVFSEYEEALKLAECQIDYYVLKEENGFHLDDGIIGQIETGGYDMVILCSPNNPTGIPVEQKKITSIIYACHRSGARMLIDECFMDFVLGEENYTVLPRIESLPNVIILKSFTKLFAMAGLRLGFCLCGSPEDAEAVNGCMQTWPVSTPAAKAGIAALTLTDLEDQTRVLVALEREKLISALLGLGFRTYDSQANYIFFRSVIPLDELLLKHSVLIRNCSNYRGLEGCPEHGEYFYRIAVRTEEENRYIIRALTEIISAEQK